MDDTIEFDENEKETEPNETEHNPDIEKHFLEEMNNHRVMLVCGAKGGGKSFFVVSFLNYALQNNVYEEYYLVIPAYKNEAHGQYKFLKDQEKKKNVFIFNKYSPEVSEYVWNKVESGKKSCLFLIEDSTGFLNSHSSSKDPKLKLITTTTRHIKCGLILVSHATKSILTPVIRANCDFLLLFKITNRNVSESIYEEYSLLMPYEDDKEFTHEFTEKINKIKYNGMFMNFITNEMTMNYLEDFENLLSYHIENGEPKKQSGKEKGIQRPIPSKSKKITKGMGEEGSSRSSRNDKGNANNNRDETFQRIYDFKKNYKGGRARD
jgi:hypothetical protein